jgi:hypothetical protein
MTSHRWVSAGMAPLFVFAAAVQWNDPDPLPWIAAYLATALLAGRHALGKPAPLSASAGLGLALAVWALMLSPSVLQADAGAYTAFSMQDRIAEEARESIGLWLAASYLAWLAWSLRRANAPSG